MEVSMIPSFEPPHLRPLLSKGLALGLAGLLAACGGGSDGPHQPPPKPTPPVGTPPTTYELIPLNPRGERYGVVNRRGINANGQVVGYNVDPEPDGARAFMYDGTRLFELGTFGGPYSTAAAINRCGHATGSAQAANGAAHAFLYDGTLRDLGPGGGVAINDCGSIAGSGAPVLGNGFVYDGTLRPVGTFPGGTTSTPVDINASGLVTGTADRADGSFGAFLYDSKARTPLQDLGSLGGNTIPRAVNDAGTVVGWSFISPRILHAFIYSGGTLRELGSFDKSTTSEAIDINAAGQVVANALGPDGVRRGYFYDGTTLHPLGDNTETAALNAGGQVVGWYAAPDPRAMLWTRADGIVDLNTRLHHPPAGLRVLYGLAISDNGAIVARANTGLVLLKPRR
jgi:probable HAF family extracellular repeat protein